MRVSVVIPALDEEASIGRVLDALPPVHEVVVVDNGSRDATADVARRHGARVVFEPRRGYGAACLAGIAVLDEPDVVAFVDADLSDRPEELPLLLEPIRDGRADLVIGSRVLGRIERGALTPQQRFGNALACFLMRLLWRARHTDLGPFRAIRAGALRALSMDDRGFGWTVQMQARAARRGLAVLEVPVSYRPRIGVSKISGTVRGVLGAGFGILARLLREAWTSLPGRERIVVFARLPEPGRAKTRLQPALGARGAAALQARMTAHAEQIARAAARARGADLEIRVAGGGPRPPRCVPQGAGDLGARMDRAFFEASRDGFTETVIVGTDCPDLTPGALHRALSLLRRRDAVFGPAEDGGYWLVGLRRPRPALFSGMPWGGPDVLARTRAAARGLRVGLLETLRDVDRPEDLGVWRRAAGDYAISVVIPARDEEALLPRALESARAASRVESIVADGGSADRTVWIARESGARVVAAERGRARQMNAGARAASGDVLLFLRADTVLPSGWDARVRAVLSRRDVAVGAFDLAIDARGTLLRLTERTVRWRSRHGRMPSGDQAIFVRRADFERVGGYPEVDHLEDVALIRRLRRLGRVVTTQPPVVTSARSWRRHGWLRATFLDERAFFAGGR